MSESGLDNGQACAAAGCWCCQQSMPVGRIAVTSGCRSSTAHQAEATVPQCGYAVDSCCHRSNDHLQSASGPQGTGQL